MALLLQERTWPLRSLIGSNPRRLVVVADIYLDDSGTHGPSPIITMAGYIFAADELEQFERRTKTFFKAWKVSVFHARKFHKRSSGSPFAGWGDAKQVGFADGWLDIAKDHALRGISIALPKAPYEQVRKEHRKNLNVSAYGQCLNDVLAEMQKEAPVWDLAQREGMAFILELGNKNNEGCVQFFNKVRREQGLEKELRRIGYATKEDCYAIQLADFLAFYTWHYAISYAEAGKAVKMPPLLDLASRKVTTIAQLGDGFIPHARQRRRQRDGEG